MIGLVILAGVAASVVLTIAVARARKQAARWAFATALALSAVFLLGDEWTVAQEGCVPVSLFGGLGWVLAAVHGVALLASLAVRARRAGAKLPRARVVRD